MAPKIHVRWLILVLVLLAAPAAAEPDKRAALLIGNAAYRTAPLKNPINDARAMAATLKELGFRVTTLENATRQQMQKAMLEFGRSLDRDTAGLFYFAGHGMQVRGSNYLVPVGSDIASEDEVEVEAVDANYMLSRMASAGNRLNIVVLDACRDNPFGRGFRSGARGLAAITAPSGTVIAYATAPGSVAIDGAGDRGLFTGALVDALREPGLRLEDIFKRARAAVMQRSNGQQTPWESSSLLGDFYFRARPAPAEPRTVADRPAQLAAPPAAVTPVALTVTPPRPAGNRAELGCPRPGTVVGTSAGGKLSFFGGDGLVCPFRAVDGNERARWGVFWTPEMPIVRQYATELRKLWPLEIGKQVSIVWDEGGQSWNYTYRVVRRETVTVPAGGFDTFLVEIHQRGIGTNSFRSVNRNWYAPAVGYAVKYEYVLESGHSSSGTPRDWHATEIVLPNS